MKYFSLVVAILCTSVLHAADARIDLDAKRGVARVTGDATNRVKSVSLNTSLAGKKLARRQELQIVREPEVRKRLTAEAVCSDLTITLYVPSDGGDCDGCEMTQTIRDTTQCGTPHFTETIRTDVSTTRDSLAAETGMGMWGDNHFFCYDGSEWGVAGCDATDTRTLAAANSTVVYITGYAEWWDPNKAMTYSAQVVVGLGLDSVHH